VTPEGAARLVRGWVRLYTRGLPRPVARRRIAEIDADLHDHIAHERARGTSERRIARSIAARMLRGIGADVSWRARPARRVLSVTAAILLVPLVGTLVSDEVAWTISDFVTAGLFLLVAGTLLELAPRRRAYRTAGSALGAVAIALGFADDAPGLVLFGLVLIAAMAALAVRARRPTRRG
jgi:hypothetical protein